MLPCRQTHTVEDAQHCCNFDHHQLKKKLPLQWRPANLDIHFSDISIQRCYEYFLLTGVSRFQILFWFILLFVHFMGLLRCFLGHVEGVPLGVKMCMMMRLGLIFTAIFTLVLTHWRRVSPRCDVDLFERYVRSMVLLSNVVVVGSAVVNSVDFILRASLGSCFSSKMEDTESRSISEYNMNCNAQYDTGGPPTNFMFVVLCGNIIAVSTLKCHSVWAAKLNYFFTLGSVAGAALVTPDWTQSIPFFFCIFSLFSIYEGIEKNSLSVFGALLDLESTKRIQTSELKHFIGNVAHDLKTPLHGFSMSIDDLLVDSQKHMPEGKEKIRMIHSMDLCKANCSFMTTAINRTVDFTKCASNVTLSAKMETSSVVGAMQWAVTCLTSTQSKIPIEVMPLEDGMCDSVITDKHWLMENMLCYLSNAVRYSSEGKITIWAGLQEREKLCQQPIEKIPPSRMKSIRENLNIMMGRSSTVDILEGFNDESSSEGEVGKMICIAVEDEGIGIDIAKKKSLFQPFQQTMRLAGGTGLGLYSLAKRVEVLNGKYGVTGRLDGKPGSRFWFSIPYNADVDYVDDMSPMISEAYNRNACEIPSDTEAVDCDDIPVFQSAMPTALIVEDSVVITKSMRRMFSRSGYHVDVAENGAIGLAKMKRAIYDIVIMDLQMPVMDGLEATRRIRLFESDVAFISSGKRKQLIFGASANDNDEVRAEALASGMNAFVPKPFTMENLIKYEAGLLRDFEE